MTAPVWPQVKAKIAATIPTLSGLPADVEVVAGPPVTGDAPEKYVTVGFVDGDNAGTYQTALEYDGFVRREVGEVRSQIVAQLGDSDSSLAETDAFAIAEAIDAWTRDDRTLGGVLSPDSVVETTVEVHSVTNANGTATVLIHSLRYTTTTT